MSSCSQAIARGRQSEVEQQRGQQRCAVKTASVQYCQKGVLLTDLQDLCNISNGLLYVVSISRRNSAGQFRRASVQTATRRLVLQTMLRAEVGWGREDGKDLREAPEAEFSAKSAAGCLGIINTHFIFDFLKALLQRSQIGKSSDVV